MTRSPNRSRKKQILTEGLPRRDVRQDNNRAPINHSERPPEGSSLDVSLVSGRPRKQIEILLPNNPTELDRLRKDLFDAKLKHISELSSQINSYFKCMICNGPLVAPLIICTTGCGHTFCTKCILSRYFSRLSRTTKLWTGDADCPTCYRKIPTPKARGIQELPLPFATNWVLERARFDLCKALGRLMDDIFAGVKPEAIPECLKPEWDWRKGGEAEEKWWNNTKYWRSEFTSILSDWGELTYEELKAFKEKFVL